MGFRVGQRVICKIPSITVVKDCVYTIKEIIFDGDGLILNEVEPRSGCLGFHKWRFEPLELDHEFVNEVIKQVTPKKQEV